MKLQGFDYFITKTGVAVFPDQVFLVKPTEKMASVTLEPNDTIDFYRGVKWLWKNNKFTICAGSTTP